MKEKEELARLGDRIRVSVLEKFTVMSDETGISRQQLTDDAMSLYLKEADEMVRQRYQLALSALKKSHEKARGSQVIHKSVKAQTSHKCVDQFAGVRSYTESLSVA